MGEGVKDQRSMNLTRTKEAGQTVVPTCNEALSWWNDRVLLATVRFITGESVKRILCVFGFWFSV